MDDTNDDGVLGAVCRGAARLISVSPTPVLRIAVRSGDVAVEIEWPATEATASSDVDAPVLDAPGDDESLHYVRASVVGTFYRAPRPDAAPFVSEGDIVQQGQQVAILETMKLMTPVEAGCTGRVAQILVADGQSVEFDTPLIALAPAA